MTLAYVLIGVLFVVDVLLFLLIVGLREIVRELLQEAIAE